MYILSVLYMIYMYNIFWFNDFIFMIEIYLIIFLNCDSLIFLLFKKFVFYFYLNIWNIVLVYIK